MVQEHALVADDRLDGDAEPALSPQGRDLLERHALGDVGLAGADLQHAGVVVRDVVEAHRVEVRLALVPVVRVALHRQVGAAHPLVDDERAGRHRVLEVLLALLQEQLLRDDRGGEHADVREQGADRASEVDPDRARAGRPDALEPERERGDVDVQLRVHEPTEREDDVLGREQVAVREAHSGAEVERPGLAAVRLAPRSGERRRHRGLRVRPGLDERVEDLHPGEDRAVVGRPERIERKGLEVPGEAQRAPGQ